jgi:hypothetical protein
LILPLSNLSSYPLALTLSPLSPLSLSLITYGFTPSFCLSAPTHSRTMPNSISWWSDM